jgi:hypothetical protein
MRGLYYTQSRTCWSRTSGHDGGRAATGAESNDHSRPAVPPGQQKDKDKNHRNGHGHEGGNGKGNRESGGGKQGK